MYASEIRTARTSGISRLLSQQGKVFALEAQSTVIFNAVLQAATTGFPRTLVTTATQTLESAVHRGETLSPRSAELLSMLKKTMKSIRTPRLFQ